ncbi:Hypothetical protein CINCED_3A006852, partial [Cinara cedri]
MEDYENKDLMDTTSSIRGGLVQAGLRYAKANNEKTPEYDEKKDKSWLIYQD